MARTPDDRLRRLASHYEGEVGRTRAERLAASALLRARPYFERPRRRWVLVASSVGAVLLGALGLGALADQAVPGQVLYPIDRAYESVAGLVGISEDRSEERLVEALALIDRGREVEAVALIDEAIEYLASQPRLQTALLDAPGPITSTTSPEPTSTTLPAAPPTTVVRPEVVAEPEPPPVLVAAADPSTSLRLATESLLRSVREARSGVDEAGHEEVGRAASELIAAAQVVRETTVMVPPPDVAGETTTTSESTATSSDSTTTSEPSSDATTTTTGVTDSTTTTTEVTDSTTSTTEVTDSTTTTVPGEGQGPGPIIIPPLP